MIEEILLVVIKVMVKVEEEIPGVVMILVVEVNRVDPLLEEGMKQIRDGNMIQVEEEAVATVGALLLEVLAGAPEAPMEEVVGLMAEGEAEDTVMGPRQIILDFTEMNAPIEEWKMSYSILEMGKVQELISTRFFLTH